MNLFRAMEISASGLNAQRMVTHAISMNLANIQTTWTEEGGPYVRRQAVLSPSPISSSFSGILASRGNPELVGVKAEVRVDDSRSPEMLYDPSHPHADESGYVALPSINMLEEMVKLAENNLRFLAEVQALLKKFEALKFTISETR